MTQTPLERRGDGRRGRSREEQGERERRLGGCVIPPFSQPRSRMALEASLQQHHNISITVCDTAGISIEIFFSFFLSGIKTF